MAAPLILLAGWINLKIFLFCPLTIYITNAEEMRVAFHTLLLLYFVLFLASMAILISLGLALPRALRQSYVAVLAAMGGLLWLQSDVLLWNYGPLDGTFIDWQQEAWKGYVDTTVWMVALIAAVRWRRHFLPMVKPGCLLLLAVQVVSLLLMDPGPRAALVEKTERPMADLEPPDKLFRFAATDNIIHMVLDEFQSDIFEELVTDSPRYGEALQGFTFFRDATTVIPVTHLSVPSFMSATTYRNHVPVWKFKQQTLEGRNVVKALADAGYQIDIASSTAFLFGLHRDALLYYRIPHPFQGREEIIRWQAAFLLDLSLFRLAPHFIKRIIYNQQAWRISSMSKSAGSGLEFRHFSENKFLSHFTDKSSLGRDGPVYKYIHLITPHPPMVVDKGDLPAKIPLEYTRENFKRQSAFTLDRVVGLLDKLRALAIYDDSTIIIQSDHGGGVSFKLQEAGSGRWVESLKTKLRVWGAVLPLLLVKPAQSEGPLRVSEAQIELNDLPATLSALLGLPENFGGKNVFTVKSGEGRNRRFYCEKSHRNEAAKSGYFEALQEYVISGSVFQESSWRKGRLYQKPAEFEDSNYLWGTLLTFGKTGNVYRFLLDGWSVPGESGTWTESEEARLGFRVTPPNSSRVLLSVTMLPFIVPDRLPHQRVLVHINDEPIGEWILTEKMLRTHSIAVPASYFQEKEVVISFRFPNAAAPKEMGVSGDVRTLAALFFDVTLHDGDGP